MKNHGSIVAWSLIALTLSAIPSLAQSIYTPYTFTTLAGQAGNAGSVDGSGRAARFNEPAGLALDGAGNLYVADSTNETIRKVTSTGVVTTLAGLAGSIGSANGTGTAARFQKPLGVAVDTSGNVYVADSDNETIRKVTPAGVVTTLAGLAGSSGSADGTTSAARFFSPTGVGVDGAGNVYVADRGNSTIRKITPGGVASPGGVTTLAGLAGSSGAVDGTGSAARFGSPEGVAVDSAGNVYVADLGASTIRKITPAGAVTTVAGLAGTTGSADGTGSAVRFNSPAGVAVDKAGNVYITDYGNATIRRMTPTGAVTTLAGLAGATGSADGTGSAARFNIPFGVAVDNAGNVYVSDVFNQTIQSGSPATNATPPTSVSSTYAVCGDTNLTVAFSRSVSAASAANPAHYQVVCGGQNLPVLSAQVSDDGRLVTLILAGALNAGGNCSLLLNGVQDSSGNTLNLGPISLSCAAGSCAYSSGGTEFWLTFPSNYAPDTNHPPQALLYLSGVPGTVGSVSMPNLASPFIASFTIPAGGLATVPLPASADLGAANDMIQSNGVHIVASAGITVDAFDHVAFSTDAYLALPTKALGTLYMVLGYKNVSVGAPELNGSEFAIVAGQDNTDVTIVPSTTVGVHPSGIPFNIRLMTGQTYQLRSANDAPADLSGTTIASSLPIAVFGGHQCAGIPSANVFFCDYVVEQLLPTSVWGTNYLTAPLATRLIGDTFRCLALQANTTVYTNGVSAAVLGQGGVAEFILKNAAQITSTKPTLVAQYANSSDYDGVVDSDPFMMLVPPTSLYAASYQVTTPDTNYFPSVANFLNIVAPSGSVGQVVLDGTAIPAGSFLAIGTSGYSEAQVPVPTGPHNLYSSNGLAFGVGVYGWSLYDAYGYPGGFCSAQTAAAPRFNCATNKTVQCGSAWSFDPPTTSSGCAGASLTVTVLNTVTNSGPCPLVITRAWLVSDACGNTAECSQTVTAIDSAPPVLTCAGDKTVSATAAWSFDPPRAYDTCCGYKVAVVVVSTETNAVSCGQAITQTWRATDCCGNSATCHQTVTVASAAPPAACTNATVVVFSAGTTNDNFAGAEPAFPSAGLRRRILAAGAANVKGFDDCQIDTFFAHTFTNLPSCVTAATLRIRLRACGAGSENDTFGLSFTSATGALLAPGWGRYLGNGNGGGSGLLNTNWSAGATGEIVLDLAQLPNADGSTADLIPALNANGFVDLVMQDDSAIDYAVLTITSCCCGQDVTVSAANNDCCVVVTYKPPQFVSQCQPVIVTCSPPSGACFPVGTTLVECKATDASGQIGRCFFKVTVRDSVPPVIISCPTNVIACATGKAGAGIMPDLTGQIVATDNCTPASQLTITQNPPAGAVVTAGPVTFTVTDTAGNASTCVQAIRVLPCCVPPPSGLTLWLTFDETSGLTAGNSAGGNDGVLMNGVTRDTNGYVNSSLCFDGADDYVSVPNYAGINPGIGDLSLDAWVKRDPNAGDSPPRIIVDKRDPVTTVGYSLAVSFGNLLFQMGSPAGGYTNYRDTSVVPADNQWHFVALTVSRAATNGGRFYVDGNPTGGFSPALHQDSLDNVMPLRVGSTPLSGAAPWLGCIDEVEMFRRALRPDEISALFNARSEGKCRPSVTLPAFTSICANVASVVVSARICNASPTSQTYSYVLHGLAPGLGLNSPGPTSFSPAFGSITVPGNSCASFPVTIGIPANLPCGAVAGYELVVIPADSTERFASQGSLIMPCRLCLTQTTNILREAVRLPGLLAFTLTNTSADAVDLTGLRFRAVGPDQNSDLSYVSLNGLPPGTPFAIPLSGPLPPGGQLEVSVTAQFSDYSPGASFTVVLEADTNGDGEMEPLGSTELVNVIEPTSSVLALSRSPAGALTLEWPMEGWTLQAAGNIAGPWSDVTGATSPYTPALTQGPVQFYRLIQR